MAVPPVQEEIETPIAYLIAFVAALVLLDVLAVCYGADSREHTGNPFGNW